MPKPANTFVEDEKTMKKGKYIGLRLSSDEYELLYSMAEEAGQPVSFFIRNAIKSYIEKDVSVENQLIAANMKLDKDISVIKGELSLIFKFLENSMYSHFITSGKEAAWEFINEENGIKDRASLMHGKAVQNEADKNFNLWMNKFYLSKGLRSTVTEMVVDRINVIDGE